MSHNHLGTISTNKTSLFKINATSSAGVQLEYDFETGKLPQGLTVHPSGEIFGTTSHIAFDLDEGTTTLDAGTTTVDKKFTFTVRATNKDRPVTSTHEYSLTLKKLTNDQIADVYLKINPDKKTKKEFGDFVASTKVFPPESLYRMSDPNFKTGLREVLLLSGVSATGLNTVQDLLDQNFFNTKLRIGEIKVGKAKNPNGDTIYEVVYAELEDDYATSPNTTQDDDGNVLYINSIKNMRSRLKDNLTVESFEYLPHWMKSTQDNQITTGYKLALPLRYVQPGEGDKIVYKLKNETSFDLQKVYFQIDRLYVSNHTGTTIDATRTLGTATGDGNQTAFTIPQAVTQPKNIQVTIDGVSVNTIDQSGTAVYTVSGTTLTFTNAPANGSAITFKRKKTTFGINDRVTFDRPNEEIPKVTADTTEFTADISNDTVRASSDRDRADTSDYTADHESGPNTLYDTTYAVTVETTFDSKGTTFSSQPITFDQVRPENTQLAFSRENVMDGINNTSKHRDLIRKAI